MARFLRLYLNGLLVARQIIRRGIFAGTAGVGLGAVSLCGACPLLCPLLNEQVVLPMVRLPGRNFALQSSSF